MRDRFLSAWRVAAHTFWVVLLVWLANRGLRLNPHWSSLIETALIGAGAGVWAAVVGWLQTRTGTAWWATAARALARFLVFGNVTVATYPRVPAPDPAAPAAAGPVPSPRHTAT